MDGFTVAILGDYGVGKTALALREYNPPYGNFEEFRTKLMVDERGCEVHVIQIWGDELYAPSRDVSIQKAHGFLLVYSISSRATFNQLEQFRQMVVRAKGSVPPMIVVGNNLDEERQVTVEETGELAARFGCPLAETSARTAENVNRVFVDLVRMIRGSAGGPEPGKNKRRALRCVIM